MKHAPAVKTTTVHSSTTVAAPKGRLARHAAAATRAARRQNSPQKYAPPTRCVHTFIVSLCASKTLPAQAQPS